jgi:hypothetical protein
MARRESDREDLLREATALVERIELAVLTDPPSPPITAGFRSNGTLSIFFGADSVYHFNERGELRRAYCNGLLYKADRGRLASLRRVRQQHEVQLVRSELSVNEQAVFLQWMSSLLGQLRDQLARGDYRIVGQVPPDADVLGRLFEWLNSHDSPSVAARPHAQVSRQRGDAT